MKRLSQEDMHKHIDLIIAAVQGGDVEVSEAHINYGLLQEKYGAPSDPSFDLRAWIETIRRMPEGTREMLIDTLRKARNFP